MYKLIEGDIFDVLPGLPKCECLIADPPDNIFTRYQNSKDNMSEREYRHFISECLYLFTSKANTTWVSYNAKWTYPMGDIINSFLITNNEFEAKPFIQTFTFGQHNSRDCGNGHRPILRLRHKDAPLYPDQIRVPSWRLLNGDKRADIRGCVPLDIWPFPRVTGNSKQRRKYHPNQLNENLVARMIQLSTKEGDTVYDAFSGTGTTLRVCKQFNRNCISIESDSYYCEKLKEEHPEI